jgi:hypothetical protein
LRGLLVQALHRDNGDVTVMGSRLLRRCGLGSNPPIAAVVTHSIHSDVIDHGLVVDIGDPRIVDVVH